MSLSVSVHVKWSKEEREQEVRDLIARADNGLDVYKTLLPPYIGGKAVKLAFSYCSPFRHEKNPSFNLFRSQRDGTVWWCDQVTESGNCLKFIMRLRQCDFREAIRILRGEVLGLSPDPDAMERLGNYHLGPPPPRKVVEVIDYPKLITPHFRSDPMYSGGYEAIDNKYFPRHIFGPEVLTRYHCRPLTGYRYQHYDPDPKEARDFEVYADWYVQQPMYHYGFGEQGERSKIVRPYTPPKNGRPRKWIGNTQREHDFFGQHLLPKPGEPKLEAVALLAGNRDTMAFNQLTGIVAVASTAEGHLPTDEQLALLRRVSERQYVLYDNDKTGQKFEAVLSDNWESELYQEWLAKHEDQAGRRFGFIGSLGVPLKHYKVNDLVALLENRPAEYHPRIGTWFRQAMGLF